MKRAIDREKMVAFLYSTPTPNILFMRADEYIPKLYIKAKRENSEITNTYTHSGKRGMKRLLDVLESLGARETHVISEFQNF